MKIFLIPALLGASLAGCGHVPIRSALALRKVDLGTTAPAALRAIVTAPREIRPVPDRTRLVISIDAGDGSRHERSFRLARAEDAAAAAASVAGADRRTHVLRIEPSDLPKLSALQIEINERRADARSEPHLRLSLSPTLCREGAVRSGPLAITASLLTGELADPVPLLKDVDLRALSERDGIDRLIPPCP